jgi:hypothetical protein
MLTGSAYRVSVPVPTADFQLLTGTPKVYVKTADSGNKRAHTFCGNCGTPIYSGAVTDSLTYALRVGCLAQRALLPPKRQIWCRSAVHWSMNLDAVPKIPGQP